MSRKVEEQKGPINPSSPPTMRQETYSERVEGTRRENEMKREYGKLDMVTPKTGKK
jgi:hypothetical protein